VQREKVSNGKKKKGNRLNREKEGGGNLRKFDGGEGDLTQEPPTFRERGKKVSCSGEIRTREKILFLGGEPPAPKPLRKLWTRGENYVCRDSSRKEGKKKKIFFVKKDLA